LERLNTSAVSAIKWTPQNTTYGRSERCSPPPAHSNQGVAAKVGMLDHFIALIIVAEDHHPVAEGPFGRAGPFEEFFGRQGLIVGNGTGKRGDRFHLQPFS
jgi:hypothetical protein